MRVRVRAIAATLVALLMVPHAGVGAERDDPYFVAGTQWGLGRIHAEAAWSATTGAGSIVAVIDTGVDLGHPDLRGQLLQGKDFAGGDDDPSDDNGHGTLIAGIIAATSFNGIGVASVAPSAKILPVRVLGKDGTGGSSSVARGIYWAASHGASVLNLSLSEDPGSDGANGLINDPSVDQAIRSATAAGATVVIAAGNSKTGGHSRTDYESRLPGVLVVGASTRDDSRAAYSNYGSGLDLLAPGGGSATDARDRGCSTASRAIVTTWWNAHDGSRYGAACGTSMAVAFVSGVAALLHAKGLTNEQIVRRIKGTADDLGAPGPDLFTGAGRLNAARALGVPLGARRRTAGRRASSSKRSKPSIATLDRTLPFARDIVPASEPAPNAARALGVALVLTVAGAHVWRARRQAPAMLRRM